MAENRKNASQKRNELRIKKQTLVYNATGNKELARQSRDWSEKRILDNTGVTLTKSVPVRKQFTEKQLKRKERDFNKFKYGLEIGLEPVEAVKVKQYNRKRISNTKLYYDRINKPLANKKLERQRRYDLWKEWSKKDTMPPVLVKKARNINRNTVVDNAQLDDIAHYGFAVMFYAFIDNDSVENVKEWVKADPFDTSIIEYRETTKVKHYR